MLERLQQIRADFAARSRRLAEARGIALHQLSRDLFGDGKTLNRFLDGGSVTLRTFERAYKRLEELEAKAGVRADAA